MRCVINVLLVSAIAMTVGCTGLHADRDMKVNHLFNGKDLSGWDYFLIEPDKKMEDVWSVKDGLLICKGEPMGYLSTKGDYTNFKQNVEWRWAPGADPGNSGVLMRITGEPKALPRCMEAQLKSGDAGDMYGFHGFKIAGDPARMKEIPDHKLGGDIIAVPKAAGNEKEPGQWNRYDITVRGDDVTLLINGKKVNEADDCEVIAGKIGLQSEGGEVHFRTVDLLPLGK